MCSKGTPKRYAPKVYPKDVPQRYTTNVHPKGVPQRYNLKVHPKGMNQRQDPEGRNQASSPEQGSKVGKIGEANGTTQLRYCSKCTCKTNDQLTNNGRTKCMHRKYDSKKRI